MAQVIKPDSVEQKPEYINSIFLAGSIEMGIAEDWQTEVAKRLEDHKVTIFNPRRASWDSSWVQSIDNQQFRNQVEWELDHLHKADIVLLYLAPNTLSPISLMELGLHINSGKVIVCCPPGFWRKGNIEVVCNYYDCPLYEDLDSALNRLEMEFNY